MKACLQIAVFLLIAVACLGAQLATNDDVKATNDAAQKWLALVDEGKYGDSWDEAASFFKEKVTKQQWQQTIAGVRGPLGKVDSRQFKQAEFKTELPNAPAGKYMIMQYRTKFANGGEMIETITPMMDKDGTWRVSGYYIKPAGQ